VVSESWPLGVVLQDEGSEERRAPDANAVSIVVIKWEERTYARNSAIESIREQLRKHTESGKTLMRSEKT
jgi:hypothetical protein